MPPDDEKALADALVRVVNDPAERERMGQVAYTRSRQRYSWPALAEKVARVYDDIVTSADPPPTLS